LFGGIGMGSFKRNTAIWAGIGLSLLMTACGGGGSGTPVSTNYVLTVDSTNPASGVSISVGNSVNNVVTTGTTTFTETYASGATATLTAPATASGNSFSSWTGCTSASTETCKVTLNSNTTVTANYATPVKTTPTVTLTPSATSISATQALTVTVAVSGASGNATPTGTVVLTSGSYTSATGTLSGGSATISVAAGALATGNDTLTVTYTPDTASASTYASASANTSVTVAASTKITPTVTLTPSATSITTAQPLTVTAGVSGASGNATPTGTVVLTSGSYTSAAATLSAGSATISVAAGALATGNDTLTVTYTPDTASASTYTSASANTSVTVTAPVTYVLTVNSASPSSGVAITVSPADNNNAGNGTTSFQRTYNAATRITLSAPQTSSGYSFVSWTGCTSSVTLTCSVTLNANTTVTAAYSAPAITAVTVTPNPETATIGAQVQFTATVAGTGSFSKGVTWTLAAPSGSSLSAGTLTSTGLYTTPYPAPATVTVTATSTEDTTKSGSATVTLAAPATAAGPALTVDAGNQTHAISPLIYGMNAYYLDTASATTANTSIARWGGDDISRYNFQTNTTNSASDWYFENFTGAGNMWGGGNFTGLLSTANTLGAKTLGTVPVLGWVANSTVGACSFTQATYPNQQSYSGACGDGIYPDGTNSCTNSGGCDIYGSDTVAAITSLSKPAPTPPAASAATLSWAQATWAGSWVNSLLTNSSFGNAASGKGVAIWDLDNEPSWWDAVHRDVHPGPFTYDEVTNGGIGTALAIKTVDPTAEVSGPVMDYWWDYFYSKKDVESGWSAGPCYQPFSNPVDRTAHGGTPFIEYYLQQMAAAETTYGKRLLDYVDLHTYFAADGTGLNPAGDTQAQQERLNSTRVFWDSTYTDPNFPQPNYTTDSNYTASCNPPAQAPQLIPMMKNWVAKDYPNTKLAIDEYNFGGLESINGAVTQADILGIFGREGLDLGALWPTGAYTSQGPGNLAFAIYRNYDGKNSTFGDTALNSTSATQGTLSVYGALRSSDNAVTVVVINKTYGSLSATVSLPNLTGNSGTAQAYLLSSANLSAIVAQPTVTVTPPANGSTTSTIANYTFPAQSITLFVVPQ
jgi:hypothetical protein